MFHRRIPDGRAAAPKPASAAWLAAGFVVASAVLTWPLGAHLFDHIVAARIFGRIGLWWKPDVFLNLWILAWGTHALTTQPAELWHGNVLYPMAQPLAGSEHMLGYQWLFAPLYLATGNPVFAVQLIMLLSFVLTGFAMALLVREVTGSSVAGWVSGCVLAFSPWRFGELTRVQLLATFYLPVIVLCLSRYLRFDDRRWLIGAGVALAVQALTSYYLGYFAFALVALLLAPSAIAGSLRGRQAIAVLCMLFAVLVVLVPFSLPYLQLRRAGVIPADAYENPMAIAFFLKAQPWSRFFTPGTELYLGATACALAILGCWRLPSEVWPGRASALALAIGGYALAQGPAWLIGSLVIPLPYRILGWVIPGLSAVRYPMRFGLLTVVAVALLAGRGVAHVIHRLDRRRMPAVAGLLVGALASLAVVLEARTFSGAHIEVEPVPVGDAVPAVYRWLRANGRGEVCVEVPVGDDSFPGWYRESRYMYFSTYHWLPIVNGFTAYPIPESTELRTLARRLPEAESLETLRARARVRWVVVHRAELDPAAQAAWSATAATWRTAAEFGSDIVFDAGGF